MANPSYLFVELAGEHSNQVGILDDLAGLVRAAGGEMLAHAPAGRVALLEPGAVSSGILLARWGDAGQLAQTIERIILPALKSVQSTPLVLQVNGLPPNGLPEMMDIPTVASVPVAPRVPRNALMVIRGVAFDQDRIGGYRDIILPMMKERDSYYEVFALQPGEVIAHSGEWTDQIFAISRWPHRGKAEDFWFSRRYQTEAIPHRIGAGRFSVHVLDADD
jgi:hypothetical protein